MDILLAGRIAESRTLQVVAQEKDKCTARFPMSFFRRGVESLSASYINGKSVDILNERADYMYMVGSEGVFNALWNLGELLGTGLRVELAQIPVSEFVIAVAELMGESPYSWDSTGCVLLTAENGMELVHLLAEAGTEARVIGYLTDDNDRCIINGDIKRFLTGKE